MKAQPLRIHIIGICGFATGPLAIELARLGHSVTGSDTVPLPPVSTLLGDAGFQIAGDFKAENIPPGADIVLAGAAVGNDNPEVVRARELGIPVSHFARFLGENFLAATRNAVVAGSYGKTTTAAMLAWILESSGLDFSYMFAGRSPDFARSLRISGGDYWVLEGDEYPSGPDDPTPKFAYYHPEIALITAIDHVHQDQFDCFDDVLGVFRKLFGALRPGGRVISAVGPEILNLARGDAAADVVHVGFGEDADERITNCRMESGKTCFDLRGVGFRLNQRGEFAASNASLAALAACEWGVPLSESARALAGFRGVDVRQEIVCDTGDLTVVYDCGVYPKSLAKVVAMMRESYPGRRLCALFQPRHTLGDPAEYYEGIAGAFLPLDVLLLADCVNSPGVKNAFAFEPERLFERLCGGTACASVGPALKCFSHFQEWRRPGDVWLVLVEVFFHEPIRSIRALGG